MNELKSLFADNSVKRDACLGLPIKFLSQLYDRGYEVVEVEKNTEDYFNSVSHQLMNYGNHYPGANLKCDVIKYEKENAELFKHSSLFRDSCMFPHVGKTVQEHALELENNQRVADAFDVHCTAQYLNMEISIFFPNSKHEVEVKRFNERGVRKRHIALVFDTFQYPIRVYSTLPIHKELLYNNPYVSGVEDDHR